MMILIYETWEKLHLTCCLLEWSRRKRKGQGGQEVTSPPGEVNSLYIRNSFKQLSVSHPYTNPEKIFEPLCPLLGTMRYCHYISTNPTVKKNIFSVVYKQPNGKIQECLNYFELLFARREYRKREKWILGDFNVNLENRNTPEVLLVNRFLKDNSLKQLITMHTGLTNKGRTCIDWIITDWSYVKSSGILDKLLSDHFSIFAVRKKNRDTPKNI